MRKQKSVQPSIDILYRVVVSPVHWVFALILSPLMILMWRLENSDPVDVWKEIKDHLLIFNENANILNADAPGDALLFQPNS